MSIEELSKTLVPLTEKGSVWAMEMITQGAGFSAKQAFTKGNTLAQIYSRFKEATGLSDKDIFAQLDRRNIVINDVALDNYMWENIFLRYLNGAVVPVAGIGRILKTDKTKINPTVFPWNHGEGRAGESSRITAQGRVFCEIGDIFKQAAKEKEIELELPEPTVLRKGGRRG